MYINVVHSKVESREETMLTLGVAIGVTLAGLLAAAKSS
jgi:hypothetical protein